jgi:hypothetical protein
VLADFIHRRGRLSRGVVPFYLLYKLVPRQRIGNSRWMALCVAAAVLAAAGCGTTRWTDTARSGTEQLLISDSVERAISEMDFSVLAGRTVYLETKYIVSMPVTTDQNYIISTIRQQITACGCQLKDKADDADYVIEARAGAIGTNRNELLFGLPATQLPVSGYFPGVPSQIPEIPLAKRTAQQGVCKVAVFAYDRKSGYPVWQSGTRQVTSKAKDLWILGTGPFQKGTIYDGTKFAGERLIAPPIPDLKKTVKKEDHVWVAQEIQFARPAEAQTPAAVAAATPPASTPAPASADGKPAPAPAIPAGHQQPAQPGPAAAPVGDSAPKPLTGATENAKPLKPGG